MSVFWQFMRNRQKPDNRIDLHHCNNTKQVTYLLSLYPFQEAYPWICLVSLGWVCLMLTTPDPSSNPASACGLTDLQPLAPPVSEGSHAEPSPPPSPSVSAHLSPTYPSLEVILCLSLDTHGLLPQCLSCHHSLLRPSHLCLKKLPRPSLGCSSQPLPLPPLTPPTAPRPNFLN